MTIKASMSNKRNDNLHDNRHLKKPIFKVPEDYFINLKERVLAEISVEESELLNNSQLKKNVFTAPDNYFEGLKNTITAQVEEKHDAKIISMHNMAWFKYAAAALIVLGLVLFGLPKQESDSNLLADVSNNAIIDYLEEKQAIEYDLLSSVTDLSTILDDMIIEETSTFSFALNDNPELDFEFEHLEY